MIAPPTPLETPLQRLSALTARAFADPGEAVAAILALARELLGLTTAVVTQSDGDTWRAVHVADAAFGLAPGAILPLRDTFCSLVGAGEAVVITDVRNDPRGGRVAAPARLGIRTFLGVPLVLRDGSLYGTLCALDRRASDLGDEAVAILRVLARLIVHELEHERHLAEVRHEEEQRFRGLVQHASDGITVIGADGAVRYQSPAVARMLGYEPDEIGGIDPFSLIAPDDAALARRLVAELMGEPGSNRSVDLRVRHRDGSWRVLEATFTNLVDDPSVAGVVVNTRDVTESKRAEAALRREEKKYRTLVERLPAVVYSDRLLDGDPTDAARYVAPQVADLVGYSQAEWIAKPGLWKGLLHPEDRGAVFAAHERAERTGGPFQGEYRLLARDGREVWVRDEAVLLRDVAGRPRLWQGFMLDVTERKEADVALRASEESARELAAAAHRQARELTLLGEVRAALAHELELAPLFRTVVEATAATFGYTLVSLYLLEEDVLVLQHHVGYERVIERIPVTAGVIGRVVHTAEPELVTDGSADPVFLKAVEGITSEVCVPLLDGGRVVGALILESRDGAVLGEADLRLMLAVSEHVGVAIGRARLHTELREREARFGALIRNAPDLITILAADGTVRYESPAITPILGYGPGELVGQNALALVHPDDLPQVSALFAEVVATPEVNIPAAFRFRHKDGSWRDLEATGTNLLADPAVGGIVINSHDVSERRRTEEALRLSDRAFGAARDGVVIVDARLPDLPMVDVNPAFERISGYAQAELVGRNCRMLQGPDTDPAALAPFRGAIEECRETTVTLLNYRKDGTPFWNEVYVGPVLDEAGETTHFVGIMTDVTERRQLEEQRELTGRRMATALEVQRQANEDLERLSKTKSNFVSVVSHEFRTPLTSIQGFSELIRDEDLPPEEVREFADDINRNARRLARMTGNMLDLDRLQSGRMELRRTPVDLNAIVCEVVATLRPVAPRHAIALDLDPGVPPLLGDRDRMAQVLTNLVDNAVKYAPDGGEITVASSREGEIVHLAVSDRGVGIPPDALEAVFDRYARVEAAGHGGIPGTGLGLPIAREIVELHGGDIWAESEPGHGSTFHVVLPLADATDPLQSGTGKGRRWHPWFASRTPSSGTGGR